MTDQHLSEAPVARQLMTLRIIWGALLMGQVIFFLLIVFVLWPKVRPLSDDRLLWILFYCEVAMLLTMVPATFLLRSRVFARGRDEHGNVGPAAYASGNIIFWAGCEGASMFGLVGALLANAPWPHLIVPIIAIVFQLLTFPTGAPMRQSL